MAGLSERSETLQDAIAAIDQANDDDPFRLTYRGSIHKKEQLHGELATDWVLRLAPDASDEQLLAARAHHLRRWELPRADYPEGRSGYLRWRAEQKRRHAGAVSEILASEGFSTDVIDRVGAIIRKEGLGTDPAVQVHEDALCLVFLDTQFDSLADQLGDDKMVDVLAKTLKKMSAAGIEAAGSMALTEGQQRLLSEAVARVD